MRGSGIIPSGIEVGGDKILALADVWEHGEAIGLVAVAGAIHQGADGKAAGSPGRIFPRVHIRRVRRTLGRISRNPVVVGESQRWEQDEREDNSKTDARMKALHHYFPPVPGLKDSARLWRCHAESFERASRHFG